MAEGEPAFRVERVPPQRLYELRRRVLREDRPDSNVADPRDLEPTAVHFGGLVGERLVVSASFYPAPAPVHSELVSYQLRFMAADIDVQGRGYGTAVLEVAQRELRELGAEQLWANARDTALAFYRATGWTPLAGSEHLSRETNLAHTVIYKRLDQRD